MKNDVQDLFLNSSSSRLKLFFGNKTTVVIDEAQRIQEIGLRMKLITDPLPEIQLVATGSAAFELANQMNEPFTGRKWEYKIYPISFGEMVAHHGLLEEKRLLPHRMVFGYYPEVVNQLGSEREILKKLSLAYQIGSQVSYNELSILRGLDAKTVEKYTGIAHGYWGFMGKLHCIRA